MVVDLVAMVCTNRRQSAVDRLVPSPNPAWSMRAVPDHGAENVVGGPTRPTPCCATPGTKNRTSPRQPVLLAKTDP